MVLEITTSLSLDVSGTHEFVSLEAVANVCLPHQFLDNG